DDRWRIPSPSCAGRGGLHQSRSETSGLPQFGAELSSEGRDLSVEELRPLQGPRAADARQASKRQNSRRLSHCLVQGIRQRPRVLYFTGSSGRCVDTRHAGRLQARESKRGQRGLPETYSGRNQMGAGVGKRRCEAAASELRVSAGSVFTFFAPPRRTWQASLEKSAVSTDPIASAVACSYFS